MSTPLIMQLFYTQEIKSMLYALGDTRTPSHTISVLIEKIVYTNINRLLTLAFTIKSYRCAKQLSVEDICFVIRHSKFKFKRALASITYKELRKKINEDLEDVEITEEDVRFDWIIERGSSNEGIDTEYFNRLKRIDELTSKMSIQEYLEFTECRQASFTYRKHKKFKEFIGLNERIKDEVIDVLGVICFEMVANIVEEGLKIKKQRKKSRALEVGLFDSLSQEGLNENEVKEACRRILSRKGALYL